MRPSDFTFPRALLHSGSRQRPSIFIACKISYPDMDSLLATLLILSISLSTTRSVLCDLSFTPITPPSYPLAVRNPYLSGENIFSAIPTISLTLGLAWLPGNQTANLPSANPEFWTWQELTWSVMARVDGQTYSLFGVPVPVSGVTPGSFQSADYTSTHTTFIVSAGSAMFKLDFFSPVAPQDYVRQSLPLSYLTVSACGVDGATPAIQIYSDIDNSWTGQFGENVITSWGYSLSEDSVHVFTLTPGNIATYSEVDDMAQWVCAQQFSILTL